MVWWEWLILLFNIGCLIGSIIGSVKSLSAYKKLHDLYNFNMYKFCDQYCDDIDRMIHLVSSCSKTLIKKGQANPVIQYTKEMNEKIILIKNNVLNKDLRNLNDEFEKMQKSVSDLIQETNECLLEKTIIEIDLEKIEILSKSINSIRMCMKEMYQKIDINNK